VHDVQRRAVAWFPATSSNCARREAREREDETSTDETLTPGGALEGDLDGSRGGTAMRDCGGAPRLNYAR
jgi:hypothetical protein